MTKKKTFCVFRHIAERNVVFSAGRRRECELITKIDQLLLTQLYSNDPLKAETRHKRGF